MNQETQIAIAMVDDHDLVRSRVVEFLEDLGLRVLLQAENGRAALEKIKECNPLPDVCLLDVNMPVMDGFDTAITLSKQYPEMKIMAYSMNNDEKNIIGMFQCGAKGYITKGGSPEELKEAIISLHENGHYFGTEVGGVVVEYLRKGA